MSSDLVNDDNTTTPICRNGILLSVLGSIAAERVSVTHSEILDHVMSDLVLPEEIVGGDLIEALHLLLRSGVVESNTFDRETRELHLLQGSQFWLSRQLAIFIWAK